MTRQLCVVVMGVAGSGKTTLGHALAARLGLPFDDADNHHPPSNIAKMTSGEPLTDADRQPWLDNLCELLQARSQERGVVLACSALKRSYRDRLEFTPAPVRFVFLRGTAELIGARLRDRSDHFMSVKMLESQFAILEEPTRAIVVEAASPTEKQVTVVLEQLRGHA